MSNDREGSGYLGTTSVDDFKAWAAQSAQRNGSRVFRWYAKFTGCDQVYELDTWGDMLPCHKNGWKSHKQELKALGFVVIKDGTAFIFAVNANNAEKWLEEKRSMK